MLSLPRITVENSNRCTKCNGKNTTKMLKSFSLKFQQSYKSYWGNKRGRTNKRRNTKFLQDLDLVDSPHKERDLIGQDVDLDLLSLFPQMGARIMEGLRDRASFSSSTMEERESERSTSPRRKKGGIYTPRKSSHCRIFGGG